MRGTSASRRGGFTLLGVGPSLLLWFMLAGPPASPDQFPLFPTQGNADASGIAYLTQPWSPFGVSVDEDGYVQYDLTVEVEGVPAVDGEVYRVWITTPDLDPIEHLGACSSALGMSGCQG